MHWALKTMGSGWGLKRLAAEMKDAERAKRDRELSHVDECETGWMQAGWG